MRIFAMAVALAVLTGAGGASARTPPHVGEQAPDFALTMLDGSTVRLAELRGQVIVLNFWATWCGPCREELPLLDGYYALQKKHGLAVFAVEDQSQGSVPMFRLKKFLNGLSMPSARRVSGPYRALGGVPTNYVIGRDGTIRYAKAAAFDLEALNSLLVPLLRERAAVQAPSVASAAH